VAVQPAPAVIGRETELDSITAFLDTARLGTAALVIRGEPGIGKTTLWHAAIAHAESEGFTVLSCRPSSAETELPYAGLGDLFAHVDDDATTALPAPQRNALNVALLRADVGASPLQQRAVSAAALHVLLDLAERSPVLIAIDDLHWLDAPSVQVLRFAVRRVSPARVGVLVASRSGAFDDDRLALGDALTQVERLVVGPLELAPLDALLCARLRTAFLGPTLRRIHETSGGNPLFAIEIARSVLDPEASIVPGQPIPAPPTLPELLAARLARISPPTRCALLAASALARPTVDLVLAATAGDDVTAAVLDLAADAEVITIQGRTVRFTHPLLASVVYAEATAAERRSLHRRLADLVVDPEEQARHLGLSAERPEAEIAGTLERAARHAASRGAPEAAAALLEQAVVLTPPDAQDEVLRRKLDAADQHIAAGAVSQARALLDGVSSTADAGPTRARALHRCARVSALVSDFLTVPQVLRRALEEVGGDHALRAAIERDLVWSLAQVGVVAELVPHAVAAVDAAQASGHPLLIAETLAHLCVARCFAGDDFDRDLVDRAMRFYDEAGNAPPADHPAIASGRLTLAVTLKWTDNFEEARSMLAALRIEHIEHGDEAALSPVLLHLGELECWSGDWQTATLLAAECRELAVRGDQAVAELRAMTLDSMVACSRGSADAIAISEAALAAADAAGDWPAVIRILKAVGVHELSIGDVDAAVAHLVRGVTIEKSSGYDHRTVRIVPDAVEALIAAERTQEAVPLVHELERAGARSRRPWAQATGARCRGLLYAAQGQLADAIRSLEIAMREHDRLERPFERARTLVVLGTTQRRLRQQRAARESLCEAHRIFEALGAARWCERTVAELDRIGGRASTPHSLTPTEEQIAKLVADGRTNGEVAAALFISVKTVEANLTRIYRKLGVSSRRQLARQFPDADTAGGAEPPRT
jgi:DNA-binding CsgD family transcriptional regulator